MSTKHEGFTPGPWAASEHCSPEGVYHIRGGKHHYRVTLAYTKEDADLIADAPCLYAENQRLREALEWYVEHSDQPSRAMSALEADA